MFPALEQVNETAHTGHTKLTTFYVDLQQTCHTFPLIFSTFRAAGCTEKGRQKLKSRYENGDQSNYSTF